MKKIKFDFIPPKLRRWVAPAIGIPVLLAWGAWGGDWARFILFGHHVFWFIGIGLLINPLAETFWPSPAKEKPRIAPPEPSSKARQRSETRKRGPGPASETATERLARLRRKKALVDKKLEKLDDGQKARDK